MENEKVPKKHLIETIRDIQKALNDLLEDLDEGFGSQYSLMTLLCRVGELELCLNYNFELKHSMGKNVQLKPNRLCTCYDDLRSYDGGDV